MEYQIWHGTIDDAITVEMAENLAQDIYVSHFHRLTHETHRFFHLHFVDI